VTTVIDNRGPLDGLAPRLLPECATCPGHCCKKDMILLHPDRGDVVALYETEPTVNPITGEPAWMLAHKANGDCVYLTEVEGVGRCGAYHRRPLICRTFDCGLSYERMPRTVRRMMLRDDLISQETIDQGRRVQERRASEKAQEGRKGSPGPTLPATPRSGPSARP
jgi:Fe-S-cluster containining protein